jgi:hypothetical protein
MKRALPLSLLLLGCPPRHPPEAGPPPDPAELLRVVRAEPPAGASVGPFSIHIHSPDTNATAAGTLLVGPPDRFRLEVRGPIGGPALIVASDGKVLSIWQAGKATFWNAEDAEGALRGLTGGVAGLAQIDQILLGRLPELGDPSEMGVDGPNARYTWKGPSGSTLVAEVDPATARLVELEGLDGAGGQWIHATWEPGLYPKSMRVELPRQGIEAGLVFDDWSPAKPEPGVFHLVPPEGATIRPLELQPREAPPPEPASGPPPPYLPPDNPPPTR